MKARESVLRESHSTRRPAEKDILSFLALGLVARVSHRVQGQEKPVQEAWATDCHCQSVGLVTQLCNSPMVCWLLTSGIHLQCFLMYKMEQPSASRVPH